MRKAARARTAMSPIGKINGETGATLVELLIAVSLFSALVAVVALSASGSTDRLELKNAALSIGAFLKKSRARARSGGRTVSVRVMRIEGGPALRVGTETLRLTDRFLLTQTRSPMGLGTSRSIDFYPSGGTSGWQGRLTDGKDTYTIRVGWTTGLIEVARAQ